ncbi:MAG: SGNH/GDSL hydrolase family protein, partial [Myxococcota bacterium]
LLWRNSPGYAAHDEHGPINSLGLRGPEVPLEKTEGVTRSLSLGESSTFGDGVGWSQTYSAQLEEELRERGVESQVWNAGVRAWSSAQSLRFLQLEMERLDPDLVLFYHEVNDFLPTVLRNVRVRSAGLTDRETMDLVSGRSALLRLIRSSRLLTWLSLARARTRADSVIQRVSESTSVDVMLIQILPYQRLAAVPEGARRRPWMENPNPLVRVPDPDRQAVLGALVDEVEARGATLVLYHPAYRISVPHRCLLVRLARERGVPVIDAEAVLQRAAARDGLSKDDYFLTDDRYHPNPAGHRALAQASAEFLVKRGLVPARRD